MGLADRDYARPAYTPPGASGPARVWAAFRRSGAVGVALAALVVFWLLGLIATATGHGELYRESLMLTAPGLKLGRVWTLLTHALAHADGLHLLVNGLGLWFFGNAVRRENGTRRFLEIFLGGILAGGLFWTALWLPPGHPAPLVLGASAGVFALTAYHLADKLRDELTLLLFFIIPLTLEAGWLLAIAAGLAGLGLVLTEIPAATHAYPVLVADNSLAHSAHAAGLALGFFWRRWEMRHRHSRAAATRRRFAVLDRPASRPAADDRRFPAPGKSSAPALRPEVDRILDKINARGLGSLTAEERATLDRARDTLKR